MPSTLVSQLPTTRNYGADKNRRGKGKERHLLEKMSSQQRVDLKQNIWKVYMHVVKEEKNQKAN